jgi:uncharacterized protein YdiU (UPF0061 family)
MQAGDADFTLTFRRLSDAASHPEKTAAVRALFSEPAAFDAWETRWRGRLAQEPTEPELRTAAMQAVNPAYIPRNHRVEAVIKAAIQDDDFAPFHELVTVLANPFEARPELARYETPPAPHEQVLRTFCGT